MTEANRRHRVGMCWENLQRLPYDSKIRDQSRNIAKENQYPSQRPTHVLSRQILLTLGG